jgi:hypothetical protein
MILLIACNFHAAKSRIERSNLRILLRFLWLSTRNPIFVVGAFALSKRVFFLWLREGVLGVAWFSSLSSPAVSVVIIHVWDRIDYGNLGARVFHVVKPRKLRELRILRSLVLSNLNLRVVNDEVVDVVVINNVGNFTIIVVHSLNIPCSWERRLLLIFY